MKYGGRETALDFELFYSLVSLDTDITIELINMKQLNESNNKFQVFISHGSADSWVASQLARRIHSDCGASTFLDVTDISGGDDFKQKIHQALSGSNELLVLITPWSMHRNWIWVEMGAAWALGVRIVALLYGVEREDLEKKAGGKAILEGINILELNHADEYLYQLQNRAKEKK